MSVVLNVAEKFLEKEIEERIGKMEKNEYTDTIKEVYTMFRLAGYKFRGERYTNGQQNLYFSKGRFDVWIVID